MPSASLKQWQTVRAASLDEIEAAHASLGGSGRGRRYATQQINHAYVVLLSSQFQGFCRDLHVECAESLVQAISPPTLQSVIRNEFLRERKLKQGNATPGNIGADFGRLGVSLWPNVVTIDGRNRVRQGKIERMNAWRNAIAHQDFDPARLGGTAVLQLGQVRDWRRACDGLAASFDVVMQAHIARELGSAPW